MACFSQIKKIGCFNHCEDIFLGFYAKECGYYTYTIKSNGMNFEKTVHLEEGQPFIVPSYGKESGSHTVYIKKDGQPIFDCDGNDAFCYSRSVTRIDTTCITGKKTPKIKDMSLHPIDCEDISKPNNCLDPINCDDLLSTGLTDTPICCNDIKGIDEIDCNNLNDSNSCLPNINCNDLK
jgi:hypothetical protein